MNSDLINSIILSGCFLALFAIGELLYHRFKVRAEYTRKLSHFGTGILTFLFPVMLSNHWWVLALCSSFALLLVVSLKFNFLKSINAVDRETVGSLCYPVSVYFCFLASSHYQDMVIFYLPILVLAISDPLAALFGKRWPIGKFSVMGQHKTLVGCTAFFISSFIIALLFHVISLQSRPGEIIGYALLIAVLSTIVEALSSRGWDNLTIPLSILALHLSYYHLF
jgi:phytol kinase